MVGMMKRAEFQVKPEKNDLSPKKRYESPEIDLVILDKEDGMQEDIMIVSQGWFNNEEYDLEEGNWW